MAVPARQFRYFLIADWTDAVLFYPKTKQFLVALQVGFHIHIYSTFKVSFPFGRIRVCFSANFNVPFDWHAAGIEQVQGFRLALFICCLSVEDPMIVAFRGKVFGFYPLAIFLGVSSF